MLKIRSTPILELEDTLGLLDIRGRWETAFWWNGEPISIMWPDAGGSIAEFFKVGYLDAALREQQLAAMRSTLAGPLPEDEPLEQAFAPILQLLTPGHYKLYYYEVYGSWFVEWDRMAHHVYCGQLLDACALREVVQAQADRILNAEESVVLDCPNPDCNNTWKIDFSYLTTNPYPMDDQVFLATRSEDSLDEALVDQYEAAIRAGQRPMAILLTQQFAASKPLDECEPLDFEDYRSFIIDGHHKLTAYARAGIAPPVCWIVKLGDWDEEETLPATDYAKLLPKGALKHLVEHRAVN